MNPNENTGSNRGDCQGVSNVTINSTAERLGEENEWTDDTGDGDNDMEYQPTTEGDGEEMEEILEQLPGEEEDEMDEEEGEEDDDEYHGMIVYPFNDIVVNFCCLADAAETIGYSTVELEFENGNFAEGETVQNGMADHTQGWYYCTIVLKVLARVS
jgi:hypothetical protein